MSDSSKTLQSPSIISMYLPDGIVISPEDIRARFNKSTKFTAVLLGKTETEEGKESFSIKYSLPFNDVELKYEVVFDDHTEVPSAVIDQTRLSEEEKGLLKRSKKALTIFTFFQRDPLLEFMLQVQMLAVLAPEGVAVIDESSTQIHSALWAKDVLETDIEPSSEMMFSIHGITGHDDEIWLHTHGMRRTASPDIEILHLHKDTYPGLDSFISLVGKMLIEYGAPKSGEIVYPGKDLAIAFFPYEDAIKIVGKPTVGGTEDRGEDHPSDNLVILAAEKDAQGNDRFTTPIQIGKTMSENPLFLLTKKETDRMQRLACQKYYEFIKYFKAIGSEKNWKFLVKVGVKMDQANENEREHLWFEAVGLNAENMKLKLINDPYNVMKMKKDQIYDFSPDELVDWAILSREFGSFSPDQAFRLKDMVSS